jgi:hypothetical protein
MRFAVARARWAAKREGGELSKQATRRAKPRAESATISAVFAPPCRSSNTHSPTASPRIPSVSPSSTGRYCACSSTRKATYDSVVKGSPGG